MFGEKTLRLMQLREAGFRVPDFVAVPVEDMEELSEVLAQRVAAALQTDRYAVRSSALSEDAEQESMAGRFLTQLAVPPDGLAMAIDRVRDDARQKLGGLQEFSLIVQRFIEADYSGVTFTRNPNGDRDMVIEYHQGRGDVVVGGAVKPLREVFYRSQTDGASHLPKIVVARATFLAIEQYFGFPQDIEWCVKDGEWFILQSRPITSLSREYVQRLEEVERSLPKGKFYFAKTEVCDVAPRPSPATLDLLQAMYAEGGPVQRAYQDFGIIYQPTDFLRVFAGELFVDRERELQSLFPSHSYFFGEDYAPRPVQLKGFLISLRNGRRLQHLQGEISVLSSALQDCLAQPLMAKNQEQAREHFFADYRLLFRVNLLAQRALERLRQALPKGMSLTAALTYISEDLPKLWMPPEGLVGNTFSFTDTSEFVPMQVQRRAKVIPPGIPTQVLREAHLLLRLREYGRWLALRHIDVLRAFAPAEPAVATPLPPLPSVFTDRPLPISVNKPLGVSAGQAEGKLVSVPEEGGILVVSELSPDIARHLHLLKGVIADHGGLLSHFAIIAREAGLPVIVHYPIQTLPLGQRASMNGETGEVEVSASS